MKTNPGSGIVLQDSTELLSRVLAKRCSVGINRVLITLGWIDQRDDPEKHENEEVEEADYSRSSVGGNGG